VDQIIQKIENTAHCEYDKPEYKDPGANPQSHHGAQGFVRAT